MYTDPPKSVYTPPKKCIHPPQTVYTDKGRKNEVKYLVISKLQNSAKNIQDYQDNQDNQHLRRLVCRQPPRALYLMAEPAEPPPAAGIAIKKSN